MARWLPLVAVLCLLLMTLQSYGLPLEDTTGAADDGATELPMEDDTRQMTESTTLVSELDLILHQDDDATMFESTTDVPEATTMADVDVLAIEPAGADVQSVEDETTEESTMNTLDDLEESAEGEATTMETEPAVMEEQAPVQDQAVVEEEVATEASSFLVDTEFTTQLPDDLFTVDGGDDDQVEEDATSSTDSVEETTETATESTEEAVAATEPAESEAAVEPKEPKAPTRALPVSTLKKKKRSYEGYRVYRVILPTEESVQRVLGLEGEPGIDFWADPHLLLRPRGLFVTSAADIMASPKAVPLVEEVFRQSRLPFIIMVDNVQRLISEENPRLPLTRQSLVEQNGHPFTWQRYHRLGDIHNYMDYLRETYPEIVKVIQIGKSSQGRPIKVLHLTKNDGRKNKKAIFLDAGVHGNEWITTSTLTWMVKQLTENPDRRYDCILEQFDWYFAPVMNPDGYEYSHVVDRMWRKTRTDYSSLLSKSPGGSSVRKLRFDDNDHEEECRGADVNRNFEFQWRKGGSSTNVCSGAFAGVRPFSEPESQALGHFLLKRKKEVAMYVSLHSYAQMWLLPWGYTETKPDDFKKLFSLAKIGASALRRIHNTTYLIGTVPDLLYVASGSTQDWAKAVAGIDYSYTIELRDAGERGMILPAELIIPIGQETWAGVYAAARELGVRLAKPGDTHRSACPNYF